MSGSQSSRSAKSVKSVRLSDKEKIHHSSPFSKGPKHPDKEELAQEHEQEKVDELVMMASKYKSSIENHPQVVEPPLGRSHSISKMVIFSMYPPSHPFHMSVPSTLIREYKTVHLFETTETRHRFFVLNYLMQSFVLCVPLVTMTFFRKMDEIRAVADGQLSLLFFSLSFVFFMTLNTGNQFR